MRRSWPDDMRVIAYQGQGRSRVETRPVPSPGPGEILLRLRVCGLCGTDLFKLAADAAAPGSVLGHEIVGDVVAADPAATGVDGPFREGDRVVTPHHVACGECALCRRGSDTKCRTFLENLLEPGGFSEYVLVRARAVALAARRVPEEIPDAVAVFLEPAACVLRGIWRSGIGDEGCAVVIGGGSMGLLHLLVLRAARPGVRVALVDPIDGRRDLALRLGAAEAWTPEEMEGARDTFTDGLGVDAVFDTVGGQRILAAALGLTREGGSVVLFAHAGVGESARFDINHLFKAERRLLGTYSAGLDEQAAIHGLLTGGSLDPTPLVTAWLPLESFQEAVVRVRCRRDLKILLGPDGADGATR